MELGLTLSTEQLDSFDSFESALFSANEVMNLTRVPRDECWLRHFVDSLLMQDLIPYKSEVLDIGTGPGFPAWPLACARPDLQVTAMDSSNKMTGFLRKHPLTNLYVVTARAEEFAANGTFDVITGRAVAPLAAQLELSAKTCKLGGLVLPMRTPTDAEAAEDSGASKLGLRLAQSVIRNLPGTDAVRLFPVYEKVAATPDRYPRRWGELKKAPLTGP